MRGVPGTPPVTRAPRPAGLLPSGPGYAPQRQRSCAPTGLVVPRCQRSGDHAGVVRGRRQARIATGRARGAGRVGHRRRPARRQVASRQDRSGRGICAAPAPPRRPHLTLPLAGAVPPAAGAAPRQPAREGKKPGTRPPPAAGRSALPAAGRPARCASGSGKAPSCNRMRRWPLHAAGCGGRVQSHVTPVADPQQPGPGRTRGPGMSGSTPMATTLTRPLYPLLLPHRDSVFLRLVTLCTLRRGPHSRGGKLTAISQSSRPVFFLRLTCAKCGYSPLRHNSQTGQ